ncbi:MAG: hypothetical protein IJQ12_01490 [Lachnospiraceae bacterium]|nr:hypothetical protein [Lachnospiraceae bacterium]
MMYPYMTLGDGTEIVHSHLIEDSGEQKVIVHFERPTADGFDDARCELPSYTWTEKKGFKDEEIKMFTHLLESNAHLLFRYAASGGVKIA